MEVSVGCYGSFSCSGKRTTINSYLIGDAKAIAEIAEIAGNNKIKEVYTIKVAND